MRFDAEQIAYLVTLDGFDAAMIGAIEQHLDEVFGTSQEFCEQLKAATPETRARTFAAFGPHGNALFARGFPRGVLLDLSQDHAMSEVRKLAFLLERRGVAVDALCETVGEWLTTGLTALHCETLCSFPEFEPRMALPLYKHVEYEMGKDFGALLGALADDPPARAAFLRPFSATFAPLQDIMGLSVDLIKALIDAGGTVEDVTALTAMGFTPQDAVGFRSGRVVADAPALRGLGCSTDLCMVLAKQPDQAAGLAEGLVAALRGAGLAADQVELGIRCLDAHLHSARADGSPFVLREAIAELAILPRLLERGAAPADLPQLREAWRAADIDADELDALLRIEEFRPEMALPLKRDKGVALGLFAAGVAIEEPAERERELFPYSAQASGFRALGISAADIIRLHGQGITVEDARRLRAAGLDVALVFEVVPHFGTVAALFERCAAAGISEHYVGVAARQMREQLAALRPEGTPAPIETQLAGMHALRALIAAGRTPQRAEAVLTQLRQTPLPPDMFVPPAGGTPADCEAVPYLETDLPIPELLALRARVAAAAPFHARLAAAGFGADQLPWLISEYRRLGITLREETLPTVRLATGAEVTVGAGAFNQVSSSTYLWGDDGEPREAVFKPQKAPDPTRRTAVDTSAAGHAIGIDRYDPRLAERNLLCSALMGQVRDLAVSEGIPDVPEVYPRSSLGEGGNPRGLGVIMELAEGPVAGKAGRVLLESAEYARQATWLQLLDHIVGQADRHSNNYIATVDEDGGLRLVGVDNDACAGINEDPNTLAYTGTGIGHRFRGVRMPRVVDQNMADLIIEMSAGRVQALFEHYLPGLPAVAQAAAARLEALQNHLETGGVTVLEQVADWGTPATRQLLEPGTSYAGRERASAARAAARAAAGVDAAAAAAPAPGAPA